MKILAPKVGYMPTIKRSVDVALLTPVQKSAVKKPRKNAKGVKPTDTTSTDTKRRSATADSATPPGAHTLPSAASIAGKNSLDSRRSSGSLSAQTPPMFESEADMSAISIKFEEFGFRENELAEAIIHTGPKELHKALKENLGDLLKMGFSLQDISTMVNVPLGTVTLASLNKVGQGLLDEKYERADLIKVAKYHNRFSAFESLRVRGPNLLKQGFSRKELIAVVSCDRPSGRTGDVSSDSLDALEKLGPALRALGYNSAELVAAGQRKGVPATLESLAKSSANLLKEGYERKEILEVVLMHSGHANRLQVLDKVTPELRAYGLLPTQIADIAKGYNGDQKLELIVKYLPKLTQKKIPVGTVANHASVRRKLKNLTAWLTKTFP